MEGQAGTTRRVGEIGQSPGEGVEPGRRAEMELVKGGKINWKSARDIIDDVYVRRRHSTWPSVIASV